MISPKLLPALLQQKNLRTIYHLNEYRLFLVGCMYVVRGQVLVNKGRRKN